MPWATQGKFQTQKLLVFQTPRLFFSLYSPSFLSPKLVKFTSKIKLYCSHFSPSPLIPGGPGSSATLFGTSPDCASSTHTCPFLNPLFPPCNSERIFRTDLIMSVSTYNPLWILDPALWLSGIIGCLLSPCSVAPVPHPPFAAWEGS